MYLGQPLTKIKTTTPHLVEHILQVGFSNTGAHRLEVWQQWDSLDTPTMCWEGHITDFLAMARAAYRIWFKLKAGIVKDETRRAWHIVTGKEVVQHIRESRVVKTSRWIRRRLDAVHT